MFCVSSDMKGNNGVILFAGTYEWAFNTTSQVGVTYRTNATAHIYAQVADMRTPAMAVRLRACVPGEYGDGTRCIHVDAGKYTNIAGATQQVSCPSGTYSDEDGSTSCQTCPAGHYCPMGSSDPSPCIAGFFSAAGVDTCTPCPSNSVPNANRTACLCASGYYGFAATGLNSTTAAYAALRCTTCPTGAVCPIGTMAVTALAQPGWYVGVSRNGEFIKCFNSACVGGEQQCAEG